VRNRDPKTEEQIRKEKQVRIRENSRKGEEFHQEMKQQIEKGLDKKKYEYTERLSMRGKGEGGRTQTDFAIRNKETGKLHLVEVKSSETAPFTCNQKVHCPKIQNKGGSIVGKKGDRIGLKPKALVSGEDIELHVIRPEQMKQLQAGKTTLTKLLGL